MACCCYTALLFYTLCDWFKELTNYLIRPLTLVKDQLEQLELTLVTDW